MLNKNINPLFLPKCFIENVAKTTLIAVPIIISEIGNVAYDIDWIILFAAKELTVCIKGKTEAEKLPTTKRIQTL